MDELRRSFCFWGYFNALFFSFGVIVFWASCVSEASAQGDRERGKRLSRVVQIPEAIANQAIRPILETSTLSGRSFGERSDSGEARAIYRVGTMSFSWKSRQGKKCEAVIFYPTSRPVHGSSFSAVVYSPGLGASVDDFKYLAVAWASRGIVSVLLRHEGSDDRVWRGKLRPMAGVKEAYRQYWTARDRALAIRSAIDLIYFPLGEVQHVFADVDRQKIAVAGNDLGALGALLVAGQLPPDNGPSLYDSRVCAVLAMSPPVYCEAEQGGEVYSRIVAPLMVVTGTRDDGIVGSTKAHQRRLPFDSVRYNDRYLVVLEGGDHRVYGGHNVGKYSSDSKYQETIRVATTDFLAAYLQDDYSVLAIIRQLGTSSGYGNATVEKKLVPLTLDSDSFTSEFLPSF